LAELPKDWGLTTVPNAKGTLDIIGKDDAGHDYKVRTTDTNGITGRDVSELRDADREQYQKGEAGVREAVKRLVGETRRPQTTQEMIQAAHDFDDGEWIAAAEPIVHAGFERRGSTVGSTWAYRRGWERLQRSN
jgi:hypothetical protein